MPERSYYPQERDRATNAQGYGLSHVCYGQGVGKTSRCIGLAVRAAGAGLDVTWVQFMKSGDSGEAALLAGPLKVDYRCPGEHPFILADGPRDVHRAHAAQALAWAREAAARGADVLICDEILNTLVFGVLTQEQVLELMAACRGRTELVMSGMDAPPAIVAAADYVTEFVQRKHPYYSGQAARRGIEF
jgi:cob(I)alamin adenosyltransferase